MNYSVFDTMEYATDAEVDRLLSLVPTFRREYALRYKHTFGRFCALQSWYMLQPHLPQCAVVQYGAYGKPYLENGPEFSISHCRHAVAVAWGETPVGIDVESIRRVEDALIERTMNDKERTLIRECDNSERMFTRLWTMKEAYLKFLGTGIVDDLHHVLDNADSRRFMTIEKETYILSVYE